MSLLLRLILNENNQSSPGALESNQPVNKCLKVKERSEKFQRWFFVLLLCFGIVLFSLASPPTHTHTPVLMLSFPVLFHHLNILVFYSLIYEI